MTVVIFLLFNLTIHKTLLHIAHSHMYNNVNDIHVQTPPPPPPPTTVPKARRRSGSMITMEPPTKGLSVVRIQLKKAYFLYLQCVVYLWEEDTSL